MDQITISKSLLIYYGVGTMTQSYAQVQFKTNKKNIFYFVLESQTNPEWLLTAHET